MKNSYRRPVRRHKPVVLRSKLRKQRAKHLGVFSAAVVLITLTCFVTWRTWAQANRFLYHSDSFVIKQIEIVGAQNVGKSELLALLPFRPGDNTFAVDLSDAEDTLRQSKPELRYVSLHRRWKKVRLSVEERVPVGFVAVDGQRQGIDEENKLFPLRGKWAKADLCEIASADEHERLEALKYIRLAGDRAETFFKDVRKVWLEPADNIVLELKNGTRIFWGPADADAFNKKLARLDQVLADARGRFAGIEYISLYYYSDGRILIKPLRQTVSSGQIQMARR